MKHLILIAVFVSACANSNCREVRIAEEKKNNASPTVQKVEIEQDLKFRVKIYKYDGSLQCGMGEAKPFNLMMNELKDIKVYSAQNLNDGLMHIQQCGTPTGKANVYEIDRSELDKAKKLGFKEWLF